MGVSILIGLDRILKVLGVIETVNVALQKDSTRKAKAVAIDTGKKIKGKVTRVDAEGNKKFKYDKKRLSYLFYKNKISEPAYDYLIGELIYMEHFRKDTGTFEKLFSNIIKRKDQERRNRAIKKYEKIRDKYI